MKTPLKTRRRTCFRTMIMKRAIITSTKRQSSKNSPCLPLRREKRREISSESKSPKISQKRKSRAMTPNRISSHKWSWKRNSRKW